MKNILFICAIAIGFTACKKTEGEGGTSVIEGQVYKIYTFQATTGEWDTTYFQLDAGKDVFIIYGDDKSEVYDDKFETDYNGKYHFEYLRKGDYTLYTYADSTDNSNVKYEFPVFKHVTITSNNSTNKVADFVIEKNQ
ncbi:MAG: hypothetical protein HON40_05940 [Flavobacteriales bacterium]|jgi:hypothetical protein|nr:hypothetical protein [Flavobacteriales bacterium]